MTAIWLVIIAAGFFLDITTSGFIFSVFSISALFGLVLNVMNVPEFIQVCVFLALSIALILTMVPYIRKKMKASKTDFIPQENRLIGREITLLKELVETDLVNIDGVFWTIKTITGPIEAGQKVKLVSLEGNKYIVEKTKGDE